MHCYDMHYEHMYCTFLVGCQNPSVLTHTTRSERYRLQSRIILEHLPLTGRDHHFSPSNSQSYRLAARQASIILTTRSNSECAIGFMKSPERLNDLLSRARDGLILIGNMDTFQGKSTL
jgi:hypothetical protein